MNKLSEYLEPYKQAVIEYIKSDADFDYEGMCDSDYIIVEPDVLQCDERVLCDWDVMEMLCKGVKKEHELDDVRIMVEYVNLNELITPIDRDKLIEAMLNKSAIQEIEAKYNSSLQLEKKIKDKLHDLDLLDFYQFSDTYGYLVVHPSTSEIDFDYYYDEEPAEEDDCHYYELGKILAKARDYDIPEKNIFCGFQFHEAPVHEITEEQFGEWRDDRDYYAEHDEYTRARLGDDPPF